MSKAGFGFRMKIWNETESLIHVVQNQGTRTNFVKAKIDKSQKDTLCWLYKTGHESIHHDVSSCSKLTQKDYKRRQTT